MKIIIKCLIFLSLYSFLLHHVSLAQHTFVKNEKEMVSWLKQNAIPIKHIEAGNGFSDLQPLKAILKDVKVVGLGESTHGTREFFQFKHRMLEFLVTEMAFNTFVLEASYAACQPINEYILTGKGDLETVLTGLGYVVWDTEEVKEMIKWMREYNKKIPDEKKIKFYGVDFSNNEYGRNQILGYLKKVAPQKVSETKLLFQKLKEEEAKWPMKIDSVEEKRIQRIMPELLELYSFLEDNKEKFVSSSTRAEFEQVLKYARVMKQWIMGNSSFLRPAFVDIRSLAMAENLFYLIDQGGAQDKFVIWEHDSHLSKQDGTIGKQLHKKLGDQYYAFSILFNEGSFHKRTLLPGKLLGDLKEITLPEAPKESIPWYLSLTNIGKFIVDLRSPLGSPEVEKWFTIPQNIYMTGWVDFPDTEYVNKIELLKAFDGIIFIDRTTATRPTQNALKTVARREGL